MVRHSRVDGLPSYFYYWGGREYAQLHINPLKCLKAFYENPVGHGGLKGIAPAERPRTLSYGQARRSGRYVCNWCLMRYQYQLTQVAAAKLDMPVAVVEKSIDERLAEKGFVVVR